MEYIEWINNEFDKIPIIDKKREKNFTLKYILNNIKNKNYNSLEFCVFKGGTANLISDYVNVIYGFDSFEGLPENWDGVKDKGFFKVDNLPKVNKNVKLIKGWFNDTLDDFLTIANVVTDPGVLVVRTDSPFTNLNDIVKAETESPTSLTAVTTGAGGDDFFALAGFNKVANIAIRDIPTSGSSEEKIQVLGGHVDLAFMNYSQVEANVNSGDLRIIATMTPERLQYCSDIPTFIELGYDITSDSSRGFVAPAGIPDEAYQVLNKLFNQILNDPDFLEASQGLLLLNILGPEEYNVYLHKLQNTTDAMFAQFPW